MEAGAGASLYGSKAGAKKALAKEAKPSSLVQSATDFLRRELRKICIRHQKTLEEEMSFTQKVYSEEREEM